MQPTKILTEMCEVSDDTVRVKEQLEGGFDSKSTIKDRIMRDDGKVL